VDSDTPMLAGTPVKDEPPFFLSQVPLWVSVVVSSSEVVDEGADTGLPQAASVIRKTAACAGLRKGN
jgi:hypothetical protein